MITAINKISKKGKAYLALVVLYPSGKFYDLGVPPKVVRSLVRNGIVEVTSA